MLRYGLLNMLDRSKLIKELSSVADQLFPDDTGYLSFYQETWRSIAQDNSYLAYVASLPSSSLTPLWQGRLDEVVKIVPSQSSYSALGIDGSQVYPDRHISGTGCFMINSGGCWVRYGQSSQAELFSAPHVFLPQHITIPGASALNEELVDLVREQYELETAVHKSRYYANLVSSGEYLCLFDGGLIFWYLENKPEDVSSYFFKRYCDALAWFYENRCPVAGYISFPKSRELANLIRVKLCLSNDFDSLPCFGKIENCPCIMPDDIVDRVIVSWFLPRNCRTTLFSNRSSIVERYPNWLKPYFFYLNAGDEIVRIEVPGWLAEKPGAVDMLASFCLDQVEKGNGYPVVLAEAHEQAVVRSADREFFFELIRRIGAQKNRTITYSQKSLRKRNMSI